MANRKTKNEIIKDANIIPEDAYVTWGDDLASKQEALKASASSLDEFTLVERAVAAGGRRYSLDFSNLDGQTGSRPGLTKSDYYTFRPQEAPPNQIKAILRRADEVYQRVGLVKNVIDLMGDFASQGIRLVHRNKRIERFYRQWFKKISGKDRSERFLNNIYKSGNIVIDRRTAKISVKVADKLYRALGSADMQLADLPEVSVEKREIPWKYTFIDPACVEVAAGALSSFVSNKTYELQLPPSLRRIINSPKTEAEKAVVLGLPEQIIEAAKAKKPYPLDPNKTLVFHYKKDDWQSWAYPMIYAIMDDITVIEKLKLADMAALDGAISNIRIFKLGSLEHKIAPTRAATAKLASILGNNVGGGTMDLIWGPDIELVESNTNVHNFLGEGKYIPHLNSVYAGLGIPPTLTGTFGAAGTTNNFISLKTLTQRLQYGRDVLIQFWEQEIAIVQKAMGFKYPAKIEFDRMDLSNEDSEKALLIQLADRNVISDELLQTRFGFDPDIERSRLNRESRDRAAERMIPKSGPWHDPQFENALRKISLQLGIAAPSQVGLELDPKKSGEKNALELKQALTPPKMPPGSTNPSPDKLPKEAGEGRPKLSKDSEKRKDRTFSPRTGASLRLWATAAQEDIGEIINPILLEFFNKKNIRSLSNIENKQLEDLKTNILFKFNPYSNISEAEIVKQISEPIDHNLINNYYSWLKLISIDINRELTVDEIKQAKASFYDMVYNQSAK
jgi:hypothetical protein